MNENFKPGDVALIRTGNGFDAVGLRSGIPSNMGWAYTVSELSGPVPLKYGNCWTSDRGGAKVVRRLVVLDLDDSEKAALLERAEGSFDFHSVTVDAIREQCSPPKPEEPTGLGAVVEEADGTLWFRMTLENQTWPGEVWQERYGDADRWSKWESVDAVRVLSEGVTS